MSLFGTSFRVGTSSTRLNKRLLVYVSILAAALYLLFIASNFEYDQIGDRIGPNVWPMLVLGWVGGMPQSVRAYGPPPLQQMTATVLARPAFLFDVKPADPGSLALALFALIAIGLGAASIPAVRASKVDPAEVLRAE